MERLRADERFSAHDFENFKEAVKTRVPVKVLNKYGKDEDLARFIVAREGNVDAALRQFLGAVEWAEQTYEPRHEAMVCRHCLLEPSSHSHVPIGVEQSERSTIMYGCPARATNSDVGPIVRHVARQLEYCYNLHQTGSRWVWCVDYNGFGLKEALQGKLAAKFATLFSNHMPERLHKILLLNPPSIFQVMLKAVKPFVDKRTLNKLVPVSGNADEVIKVLREQHMFPPDALSWLSVVLKQKLPAKLPKFPHVSWDLILPSLRPVLEFEFKSPPLILPPLPAAINEHDEEGEMPTAAKLRFRLLGHVDKEGQIQIKCFG